MEFSARLVLSSNSGYSKKQVSFFHSASAYWQALLSALEGNAADRAASILLRISSSLPTATFSSIRRWSMISARSARQWLN